MYSRERVEQILGINSTTPTGLSLDVSLEKKINIPPGELSDAQQSFVDQFGTVTGLTQIDPEKFFIARVTSVSKSTATRSVERMYFSLAGNPDSHQFRIQAKLRVGVYTKPTGERSPFEGEFHIGLGWYHGTSFRRDEVKLFPFVEGMTCDLNPLEVLRVRWEKGKLKNIEFNPHMIDEQGKLKEFRGFKASRKEAGEPEIEGYDEDYMELFLPGRPWGKLLLDWQDDDPFNEGAVIKRFSREGQLLDDIFFPDDPQVLQVASAILPKQLASSFSDYPTEFDNDWKNPVLVKSLIGIGWRRFSPGSPQTPHEP